MLAAKCPVCREPLVRTGNDRDGTFWFEHHTVPPYGPVVIIFEDDYGNIDKKRLLALFTRFHRELDGARARRASATENPADTAEPVINIPLDE